jgi:hypothetical protein
MTQDGGKPRGRLLIILGEIAGVIAIIALIVAVLQLWQSLAESIEQRNVQSTLIALSEHQFAAQQTLIALPQDPASAQQIPEIKSTIAALENARLFAQASLTPGLVVQTKTTEPTAVHPTATSVATELPTNTSLPGDAPTTAATSTPTLAREFEDNFDDGNSEGWIPSIGSWEVVEGSYVCVARHYAETTYGDGLWTDYSVSADVRPFSGTVDIAVIGRWQDEQNFYIAQLVNDKAYLTGREGGSFRAIANVPYTSQNGTSYNIRLEFHGTKINMYVDNTLILSAEDGVFLKGKVGLRCASNSQAHFDNVKVIPIPNN